MMNAEHASLSEELKETQRIRSEYLPFKIVNLWGKLVEASTDTKTKKIGGFAGMMGVVILSMIIDGNFAIVTAETLAVLGGATIGEKIPPSEAVNFFKEKKFIKAVKEKKDVTVEEIASLLSKFPDVVDQEEVNLWPDKKLGEESLDNPKRYRIMRVVLNNNPEAPNTVVENFMQAQILAQKKRRTREYMRKEAWRKGIDIGGGIALMVGITSLASFGLGYKTQAGIIGLGDDIVLYGVLTYSFAKEKIKSFFSKYK